MLTIGRKILLLKEWLLHKIFKIIFMIYLMVYIHEFHVVSRVFIVELLFTIIIINLMLQDMKFNILYCRTEFRE